MSETIAVLLGGSLILFFGAVAEFLFKKTRVPDILLLILLGFGIGPHGLNYITPAQVSSYAPVFTTFALLFLLYDGAFNIDLASFARGLTKSLGITWFNFLLSSGIVAGIMYFFHFDPLMSIMVGFILGGVSSAFVIPILKQMKVQGETYSVLALESAMTDVFCIVFALTVLEIMKINTFDLQIMTSKIASLFAVAGFIGIVAGIIWIILVIHIFKEHKSYMITVAYLVLVYVIAEFLNGNGAIAALFLGLVLRNSKQLTMIFGGIVDKKAIDTIEKNSKKSKKIMKKVKELKQEYSVHVTTPSEEFFYDQISFLLKTFFFVYIGLLLNINDTKAMIIAGVISIAILITRMLSHFITKSFNSYDRRLISSIFARGLASAAIAQILVLNNLPQAELVTNIIYGVISFTIILSSFSVFMLKKPATTTKKA
jgi:potassium/hydrogen antiporter